MAELSNILLFSTVTNFMTVPTVKAEARRLIERLPEDATWEDLQHQIYFRQAVGAGLKDSPERRVVPLEEARRLFGLGAP